MPLEMTTEDLPGVEFIHKDTIVDVCVDDDNYDDLSKLQPYWIETALDWWERCHASKRIVPTDPQTAAQAFLRGDVPTGIGFVDEALLVQNKFGTTKQSTHGRREAPILELLMATTSTMTPCTRSTGSSGAATWTLISLAARFVVATRPSRFFPSPLLSEPSSSQGSPTAATTWTTSSTTTSTKEQLPKVILLDPFHSIAMNDLVSAIRSTWLLQQPQLEDTSEANTQVVVEECLSRIHVLFPAPDTLSTVAVLEALQCRFVSGGSIGDENSINDRNRIIEHNNLLLWDNFLSTIPDTNGKQEVIRHLIRLWRATNLMVVVASSKSYSELDDSFVTCRIRLEQAAVASTSPDSEEDDDRQHLPQSQHSHKATLLNSRNQRVVPFTIGTAGILS
jgi:hypothetical protein